MSYLTTEKKSKIFTEFGGKAENTGSVEAQIALLTERITSISKHLKSNKKDFDRRDLIIEAANYAIGLSDEFV